MKEKSISDTPAEAEDQTRTLVQFVDEFPPWQKQRVPHRKISMSEMIEKEIRQAMKLKRKYKTVQLNVVVPREKFDRLNEIKRRTFFTWEEFIGDYFYDILISLGDLDALNAVSATYGRITKARQEKAVLKATTLTPRERKEYEKDMKETE